MTFLRFSGLSMLVVTVSTVRPVRVESHSPVPGTAVATAHRAPVASGQRRVAPEARQNDGQQCKQHPLPTPATLRRRSPRTGRRRRLRGTAHRPIVAVVVGRAVVEQGSRCAQARRVFDARRAVVWRVRARTSSILRHEEQLLAVDASRTGRRRC